MRHAEAKTIGIVAHSAEGGALCFITACREGAKLMGEHMHPEIVLSAVPMALSMPGYLNDDHDIVAEQLAKGVRQVADAGADFYICPDNTAHIVLEKIAHGLPIPGLHIADVVCDSIKRNGWQRVGLLGTKYTMTGPVYERSLGRLGLERLIPDEPTRENLNAAIFDELCNGVFRESTTRIFVEAISELKARGAECVILGCTEIPLIINAENSPLPVLDSTRLLAEYAVRTAIAGRETNEAGWLPIPDDLPYARTGIE
jgi:aspartate racemase